MFASGTFSTVLQWVIHNGYPIMFVGMVIEGPVLTAAAAFATTLGYFNLGMIFLLAVAGDIVGDFIWYILGYFGRLTVINRFGNYFGASPERMEKLRTLFEKHPGKIITAVKLSPFLPAPGLIVAGSSHMSPKKFMFVIASIILPKTILFMAMGYFFGYSYDAISSYVNNGIFALVVVFVVAYLIFYLYKRVTDRVSRELERESQ